MDRLKPLYVSIAILCCVGIVLFVATQVNIRVYRFTRVGSVDCQLIRQQIAAGDSADAIKNRLLQCPECASNELPGGYTLLHTAIRYDRLDVASLLIDFGADPFMRGTNNGRKCWSAIELAASDGKGDFVRLFLQAPRVDHESDVLSAAADFAKDSGHDELAVTLTEAHSFSVNSGGRTPPK